MFKIREITKRFALGMLVYTVPAFTYVTYKVKKNKKEQRDIDEDENLRDTTRPQNPNFGLSWGAQADIVLMDELDTGDLVLIGYDCNKMLDHKSFVQCYANSILNKQKFDSAGIIMRSKRDLMVLTDFFGELKLYDYTEMLSRIYTANVIIKRLKLDKKEEKPSLTELSLYNKGVFVIDEFEDFEEQFKKSNKQALDYIFNYFGLINKDRRKDAIQVEHLLKQSTFPNEVDYTISYIVRNSY